jgi:hypothetical protein
MTGANAAAPVLIRYRRVKPPGSGRPAEGEKMRFALAALFLLTACDRAGGEAADVAPDAAAPTAMATPAPVPAAPSAATCEPNAPESPCPIVGHWRVAKVYNPAAADPLADDMGMTGATLTVTGNDDAPGTIRWDAPDTGQFDISDVCTGPYLSPAAKPRPDDSRAVLDRALKAWKVTGSAAAARHLGCDSGHWATPGDASGRFYGLVLPLGDRMAFEWFDGRLILTNRIG